MAYSEQLANKIRQRMANLPNVEEKPMFSGLTFMVNNKMCVGVREEEIMCRIDPDLFDKVVEDVGVRPMIHNKRIMKGFIYINEDGYKKPSDFNLWIDRALEFNKNAKAATSKNAKKKSSGSKSNASDVDLYISAFPPETQKVLKQVRKTIKKAAPATQEKISYGIPTVTFNERYLIYFAGFKKHISIYPAPRQHPSFKKILSAYKGGKGTVQFPLDKKIPYELITQIVKLKLKEAKEKLKSLKE